MQTIQTSSCIWHRFSSYTICPPYWWMHFTFAWGKNRRKCTPSIYSRLIVNGVIGDSNALMAQLGVGWMKILLTKNRARYRSFGFFSLVVTEEDLIYLFRAMNILKKRQNSHDTFFYVTGLPALWFYDVWDAITVFFKARKCSVYGEKTRRI